MLDYLYFRAIKDGGEVASSLEYMGLDYLLDINEYLDIQQAIEADIQAQIEARNTKR